MKNNTASRILRVMSLWKDQSDGAEALKSWQKVLGQAGVNRATDYFNVVNSIQVLSEELAQLECKLEAMGVSKKVFDPPLTKLGDALNPSLVSLKAVHVKQYLKEDVFTGLAFCSEFLPLEEELISREDFSELVSLINSLEILLQQESLPSGLVVVVRRHIRLAEEAISRYPLKGARSIKEAVKSAIGDLLFEPEVTRDGGEGVKFMAQLWRRANGMADAAIKFDNLAQLSTRAMKLLSDLA